jgi:hypothetical protein
VDLYIYSPISLHDIVLNQLSTGTTFCPITSSLLVKSVLSISVSNVISLYTSLKVRNSEVSHPCKTKDGTVVVYDMKIMYNGTPPQPAISLGLEWNSHVARKIPKYEEVSKQVTNGYKT